MFDIINIESVKVGDIADRIGELDAAMAPLNKERDALAAMLKEMGAGRYTGALWNATVSESVVKSVDWKAVAAKLAPSRQLVTAHTRQSPRTTLKITGVK